MSDLPLLTRAIRDAILSTPEYARIVDAMGSAEATRHLIRTFAPALARTLLKHTAECKHVLSLHDEDFCIKRSAAIARGPAWKDRGRDRKGQLFKMTLCDGLLRGWSAEVHEWVLVVPYSLQSVVFQWLSSFYAQCNESTRKAFAKYEASLKRNYAATVGERATNRGLFDLQHRRCLEGRRNKFVKVPKTL